VQTKYRRGTKKVQRRYNRGTEGCNTGTVGVRRGYKKGAGRINKVDMSRGAEGSGGEGGGVEGEGGGVNRTVVVVVKTIELWR